MREKCKYHCGVGKEEFADRQDVEKSVGQENRRGKEMDCNGDWDALEA